MQTQRRGKLVRAETQVIVDPEARLAALVVERARHRDTQIADVFPAVRHGIAGVHEHRRRPVDAETARDQPQHERDVQPVRQAHEHVMLAHHGYGFERGAFARGGTAAGSHFDPPTDRAIDSTDSPEYAGDALTVTPFAERVTVGRDAPHATLEPEPWTI